MQHVTPEDQHDQTNAPSPTNAASGPQLPLDPPARLAAPENQQPLFYTQEDDLDLQLPLVDDQDDQAVGQSSPFVLPFQNSAAMPTLAPMGQANAQRMMGQPVTPPTPAQTRRVPSQVVKILLIVGVVLLTLLGSGFFILAQSATASHRTQGNGGQTHGAPQRSPLSTHPVQGTQTTTIRPTPRPTATTSVLPPPTQSSPIQATPGTATTPPSPLPTTLPTTQFLTQLGWTQAGLTLGDAFEALRTGSTFTDREMSYDYRSIGTPENHSGTLTSATFLLTPGGKVRFAQNDKRVINNTLYNQICTGKIIQQVVNAHPTLVQFQVVQVQGGVHQFAWVDVSFELFQSKADPASGTRTETIESDTTTGQARIHHLTIVLLRIPPQNQGSNAPMGGTGWLVNTYALDAQGLPALATTPSL